MSILLPILVVAAVSPVQKAEQLYQQARYEDALKALGTSCTNPSVRESDVIPCERVRAFSLIALGRDDEARAAFDRMLVRNPDADLGPDVSPKLQSLFSAAKRNITQVMGLELEAVAPGPVAPGGAGAPWPLSVKTPGDVTLEALHVYIATASTSRYTEVALRQSNGTWVGMYDPPSEASAPRYYMVATLPSGVDINVGDAEASKAVVIAAPARDPMGYDDFEAQHADPAALKATRRSSDDDKIAGMPPWAFWTVVGGTAVVATVVIILVASHHNDNPGAVKVGLNFQ